MSKNIVSGAVALVMVVSPVFVSAQTISIPQNPTIEQLQALILQLTALLQQLLTNQANNKITLTAPNGGEQWALGVTNTVTWRPYQYGPDINPSKDVSAYLERKNGDGSYTTLGMVQATGKASIHWPTGSLNAQSEGGNYVPPGQYYIRVVNNVTGATDRSDAAFTITGSEADLYVNESSGPVNLSKDQQVMLRWSSTGTGGCWIAGMHANLNDGQLNLNNLPASGTMSAYYTGFGNIILDCWRTAGGDEVVDVVAVNAGAAPASLKILRPNGGENLTNGQKYDIGYMAGGLKSVSIALYKNDQWYTWLVKDMFVGESSLREWGYNATIPVIADASGAVFKMYITGQKADGTGYVDDKSDAPFSIGDTNVSRGTLTISTAPSSPAYQVVAGGSTNVTLGAYKFRATGENQTLQAVGVKLTSGSPSNISSVTIWNGSTQIGSGTFIGGSIYATSSMNGAVQLYKDVDTIITIKGNLASVGMSQPGQSGELIKVNFANALAAGQSSGTTIFGQGSTDVAGVRMYRSFPTVSQSPTPTSQLINGSQDLLRFQVTANAGGSIGLKEVFVNIGSQSANVGIVSVYAYSDVSRTLPVSGLTSGLFASGSMAGKAGADFHFATPSNTGLVIPAGATYYFAVRGEVSNVGTGAVVRTTLVGDQNAQNMMTSYPSLQGQGFVWSPNTRSTSQVLDADWTNGYGVAGLPATGLSQTLSGNGTGQLCPTGTTGTYPNCVPVATTTPPTVTLLVNDKSEITIPVGQAFILYFKTENADSCSGTSEIAGTPPTPWTMNAKNTSATITNGAAQPTIITYTLSCTNAGGTTSKTARVIPQTVSAATSVSANAPTYLAGEVITATWKNSGTNAAQDWIGVVPSGGDWQTYAPQYSQGQGKTWQYTAGNSSGSLPLVAPNTYGDYQLVYYANNGYTVIAKSAGFRINPINIVRHDKPGYKSGETITVLWNKSGQVHAQDWIGIVPSGGTWGTLTGGQNVHWFYTDGQYIGSKTLKAPTAGDYQLVYFVNNGPTEVMRTQGFSVSAATPACPGANLSVLPPAPSIGVSNATVPSGCPVTVAWNGGSSAYQCYVFMTGSGVTDYGVWNGVAATGNVTITSNTTFRLNCLDTSGGYIPGTPTSVNVNVGAVSAATNISNLAFESDSYSSGTVAGASISLGDVDKIMHSLTELEAGLQTLIAMYSN